MRKTAGKAFLGCPEAWAEELGRRHPQRPQPPDIIAINEAWGEKARDILVNQRSPAFPNFVREIDAGHQGTTQLVVRRRKLPDGLFIEKRLNEPVKEQETPGRFPAAIAPALPQ